MVDRLSKTRRSALMARIGPKNSLIELHVRRALHAEGYRYRLHASELPGKPDLVFPSREAIVFIHGCFWHGHACVLGRRVSKSNRAYWSRKIKENQARDRRTRSALRSQGWKVMEIWQCQIRRPSWLPRIRRFLDNK
jgi:DNA mismatch endonuclease, patch repair protein